MASDLLIRGQARHDVAPEDDFAQLYGGQVRYRPRVRVTTRAGGARGTQDGVPLDGEEDDVVEIETADGLVTFTSLGAARRAAKGGGTSYLDEALRPSRGGSPVVDVRVVEFGPLKTEIRDDLALLRQPETWAADKAGRMLLNPPARAAMQRLAVWLDKPVADNATDTLRRKRAKVPGLYAVDEGLRLDPEDRLTQGRIRDLPTGSPLLLLLHGTFSHTEAAFGGLRGTREWKDLVERYEGRILALEHPTLSKSPLQNALDLTSSLPENARLHVISHSRGGLIGDCLSFARAHLDANTDPDSSLFEQRPWSGLPTRGVADPRRKQLEDLHDQVSQLNLHVERFARVACPGNGTLLASRRIDKYASFLFNVLKVVPGLQGTGVVEAVKLLVLTFLDQRSDVLAIPGLEAMMPESPFIGTLNVRARAKADDGMASIAGDVEGAGVLKRLKVLGADAFFLGDHDMVVNTRAMVGGAPRKHTQVATFRGSRYAHSSYFTDEEARAATVRWLAGTNGKPVKGFGPELVSKRHRWSPRRGEAGTASGTVLVVPDLMGSTVSIGEKRIWPDPQELSQMGVAAFFAAESWNPDGLVDRYGTLSEALASDFHVEVFPYDGRQSLDDNANRLHERVGEILADATAPTPLHVVAHGAGGRILRRAHALAPHILDRTGHRILLSPPLKGSAIAAARREGMDPLASSLAVLAGSTREEMGQLLDKHWLSLKELAKKPPGDTTPWADYVAVYGRAVSTLVRRRDRGGRDRTAGFQLSAAGDGHVLPEVPDPGPEIPDPGPEVRYVDAPFDELVSADEPVELVRRLLLEGTTAGVGSSRRIDAKAETTPAPSTYPALFPDADDLVWRSMGAPRPAPERDQLEVRVVHGNLTAASQVLIVGTQAGTPIGGAEKALDQRLEGALSRHRLIGQYPSRLGSCQLFVGPGLEGPGAAVIGLGDPGDLTPGTLTAGFVQAVLRLVAALPDELDSDRVGRELELGTVLIGTTGLGGLNVASAVNAAITGVRGANRRMRDLNLDTRVRSLRIYELYAERAHEALEAAAKLRSGAETVDGDGLDVNRILEEGPDRRADGPTSTSAGDRWRSIRVNIPRVATGAAADTMDLFFNEIGRTAGAETLLSQGQRRIIDELIERCVGTPYIDNRTYNTLYELVVPRHMKGQGRPSEHIMYVLDDHAAKLPFEMFATRSFDDRLVPTSTEVGMIRRLEIGALPATVRPSSGRRALVIGDPYAGEEFEPLPGARHEAEVVADLLEARRFRVTRLISRRDRDPKVGTVDVLNALFAHEYRIIHIAAHGTFDKAVPLRNGVMIGPGTRLTALELRQLQTTPDLVFLNACHSGARVDHANELAANVARAFIDDGVRSVVATGWAVDDQPAAEFARIFYAGLLGGDNLGMATLAARQRVYDTYGTSNTWGAYQVYGEPAFQFERDTTFAANADPISRFAFRNSLSRLADRAKATRGADPRTRRDADLQAAGGSELQAIRDRLVDLEGQALENGWLEGTEYQEVGEVWRDLADYERAIEAYERALAGGGSAARLDIVAQLVSAHAHEGGNHRRNGSGACTIDHFARADNLLELWTGLVALGTPPTPSRVAAPRTTPRVDHLRSRANLEQHRLWLHVDNGPALDKAIAEASRHFEAAAYGLGATDRGEHYVELGAITLGWLAWHRKDARSSRAAPKPLLKRANRLLSDALGAPWSSAPFERLRVPDAELVLNLLSGEPPTAGVLENYTQVFKKAVSVRERESVLSYLEFLHRVTREGSPQRASVDQLRRGLVSWVPGFRLAEEQPPTRD